MADLERRVALIEEHLVQIVATLDTLATNQNHLDEALLTLTEAQIRTEERFLRTEERFLRNQEQFRETDARIANLTSAIGQLITEMRSKPN